MKLFSGRLLAGTCALVFVLAFLAMWRWTALSEWADPQLIASHAGPLHDDPLAGLWICAAYVVLGFGLFPVTALSLGTTMAFGAKLGFAYALAGSVASAAAMWAIGRCLGRRRVDRISNDRVEQFVDAVRDRGLVPVAVVRNLPVAPFGIVNLVFGAAGVPFGTFVVGTAIGMSPGTLGLAVFGDQLTQAIREPGPASIGLVVVALVALAAGTRWVQKGVHLQR